MKRLLLAGLMIFICENIFPQIWQSIGIPEGSGVTDMVYWKGSSPLDDKLWVTTGSVDWPTGQRGGVFYSATTPPYQGIWYRLGGSAGYYVGRTLAVGQDGNLYASLWRNPATFPADALCRLSVQAATFGVLYQASAGDNIFSIAVKNMPHTIFAGTRNGVIRSTDNGATFGYSNNGIPDSAWVYDIAIDSSGLLAIASSKGVFITEDNGNTWLATAGIPIEDTVVTLEFVGLTNGNPTLMAGTLAGNLYKGILEVDILNQKTTGPFFLLEYFFDLEVSSVKSERKPDESDRLYYLSLYGDYSRAGIPGQKIYETAGVYQSSDHGNNWNPINDGLPPEPRVSALTMKKVSETYYELYAGLFNDTTNGAGIYKLGITVDVEEVSNQIPSEYKLEQNYPNPFNPSTTIQFSLTKESFTKLEIYNSLGQKVSTLVSEILSAGTYEYEWNAVGLTSGVYFYGLITDHFSEMKKMVLLR